jgi:hypothetical protein
VAVRRGRCFDTLHTVDGCAAPYKKEAITEGLLLEETTAVMHRCERSGHHLHGLMTFASPRSDDQAKNLQFASLVGWCPKNRSNLHFTLYPESWFQQSTPDPRFFWIQSCFRFATTGKAVSHRNDGLYRKVGTASRPAERTPSLSILLKDLARKTAVSISFIHFRGCRETLTLWL